jgi:hypothetical protein
VRLEVGAREPEAGGATVVRRDQVDRTLIPLGDVVDHVVRGLTSVQHACGNGPRRAGTS